ncbi:kelch-like protein 2 [Gigantopelta aegis]|uniref:kelch-like protein 2 n=1 Tax=Gigantopelta aegis TaxID=1735272 RepID=UPI001B888185|nr:kelch-like protein 2 [Gigantopelta aegis]
MENTQGHILLNIHQQIVNGDFNDLHIVCNDGTTTGSRLVLAALSPYFRAMFASKMTESRTNILKLPSISLSIFEAVLKMYLCTVNLVNENNCVQLLDAAEMMQLDHIKELCNTFLRESQVLTCANCLSWWRDIKLYHFLDLSNPAFCYLIDNLTDFVETEMFVQLSKTELVDIISKDNLKCDEDIIVRGAMKWIEHNTPDADDVRDIFEHVRLDIVSSQVVSEIANSNIVRQNSYVQRMLQQVLCQPVETTLSRFSFKRPDVFVLQHDNNLLLSCFTSKNKWEDVPPAPVDPGDYYAAASLDNKIYITGGKDKQKCTLIYDILGKVWTVGPSLMNQYYSHCMAAAASSKVYAIGGWLSNEIEELSQSDTNWEVVGRLGMRRKNAFTVTVGENILIMGGEMCGSSSDLIQCFNTRTLALNTLKTHLPRIGMALRGQAQLPDVHLLDSNGYVSHAKITEKDGEIHVQSKYVAMWESTGCCFGVVHQHGSLLKFNFRGITKFNLAEGKEEECSLLRSPRRGTIYNILPVWSGN